MARESVRRKQIAEPSDDSRGGGRILADEHRDGVQRVEQKVRVHLHLERLHLGERELRLELRGAYLALAEPPMVA